MDVANQPWKDKSLSIEERLQKWLEYKENTQQPTDKNENDSNNVAPQEPVSTASLPLKEEKKTRKKKRRKRLTVFLKPGERRTGSLLDEDLGELTPSSDTSCDEDDDEEKIDWKASSSVPTECDGEVFYSPLASNESTDTEGKKRRREEEEEEEVSQGSQEDSAYSPTVPSKANPSPSSSDEQEEQEEDRMDTLASETKRSSLMTEEGEEEDQEGSGDSIQDGGEGAVKTCVVVDPAFSEQELSPIRFQVPTNILPFFASLHPHLQDMYLQQGENDDDASSSSTSTVSVREEDVRLLFSSLHPLIKGLVQDRQATLFELATLEEQVQELRKENVEWRGLYLDEKEKREDYESKMADTLEVLETQMEENMMTLMDKLEETEGLLAEERRKNKV